MPEFHCESCTTGGGCVIRVANDTGMRDGASSQCPIIRGNIAMWYAGTGAEPDSREAVTSELMRTGGVVSINAGGHNRACAGQTSADGMHNYVWNREGHYRSCTHCGELDIMNCFIVSPRTVLDITHGGRIYRKPETDLRTFMFIPVVIPQIYSSDSTRWAKVEQVLTFCAEIGLNVPNRPRVTRGGRFA